MAETYMSAKVKCPFYRSDELLKIGCEGITEDSLISLSFKRKLGKDTQIRVFCCGKYENCEICRMLMEKWED